MADNDDTTSTSEVDTGESSASDEDEDLQLDPLTEIILQLTADYESIKSNNQNIRKLAAAAGISPLLYIRQNPCIIQVRFQTKSTTFNILIHSLKSSVCMSSREPLQI